MKKKSTSPQGEKVDHGYFKSNLMVCKVSSRHPKSMKTSKWSFWTLKMITRWFLQFFWKKLGLWKKVKVRFSQKVVIFRQNWDILVCKIHNFNPNDSKICTRILDYVYQDIVKFHCCNTTTSWVIKKRDAPPQGQKLNKIFSTYPCSKPCGAL